MSPQADRTDVELLADPSVTEAAVRRVLITGAVLIATAIVGTVVFGQWRTEAQLRGQLLQEGRAFTAEIVATRQFVAFHGGVYVPETRETTLNPYLASIPGIRTRIRDESGTVYVLQNPSLVVRNVSAELSSIGHADVQFHMASDRPLNPANRADGFESAAIEAFEGGATEYARLFREGERSTYRYVHPLVVAPECVKCHLRQGWKVGEVRGGVSVSIDADAVEAAVTEGRAYAALVLFGSLGTLLFVLYLVSTGLLGSLLRAETRLREMATRDPLTGLANRRAAMQHLVTEVERAQREGSDLGVLMVDLDHFKRVNDAAGHPVGDAVLRAAATGMASQARGYDTVARIGGEEFLVVVPGADEVEALAAAERMRAAVARATAEVAEAGGAITASVGVVSRIRAGGESPGDLLRRADRALYRAKDAGRDRAEVG